MALKIIVAAKLYYPIRELAHRVRSLATLPVINVHNSSYSSSHSSRMFQEVSASVRLQTPTGVVASCYSGLGVGRTDTPIQPNASLVFHSDKFQTCVGKVSGSRLGLWKKHFVTFLCRLSSMPEKTGKAVPFCFFTRKYQYLVQI